MVESKLAGLIQVLRAQSSQLLGQCEALSGGDLLTKDQRDMLDLEQAVKDLQGFEDSETMDQTEFQTAHKRIQEVAPKVREIIASLSADQKKRYDKKAEKKVNKASLAHREKLQKQLDEVSKNMPEQHKQGLHAQMKMMPIAKQEQLIAELVASSKRREAMTEEERQQEDAENKEMTIKFNAIMQGLDDQQKQIIMGQMQNQMPSGRIAYMKKLVEDGAN